MAAIITNAGAKLIAEKQAAGEAVIINNFIFAYLDDLDFSQAPNPDEVMPPAEKIQYRQDITKAGYVNPAQVVYSVIVGSDIGDWAYNWIGLQANDGVLFAVAYLPTQQKVKNIPPSQIGNTITRNFLVAFDGAQSITQITIPAESWQFDITDKLDDMDERTRTALKGVFGRSCFFQEGFKLQKMGSDYLINSGVAYIEGIRLADIEPTKITPPDNANLWLDVVLKKINNIKQASFNVAYGDHLKDYKDPAGDWHYLINIAVVTATTIIDKRSRVVNNLSLIESVALLRGANNQYIENLPNKYSDNPDDTDQQKLASIAALQTLKAGLVANDNGASGNAELTPDMRGFINVSAQNSEVIITLPPANITNTGVEYTIRRLDNSDNSLTIKAVGDDTVLFNLNLNPKGYKHFGLFGAGDFWQIYCNGAGGWYVLNRYDTSPLGSIIPILSTQINPGGYIPLAGVTLESTRMPWLKDYAQFSQITTTAELAEPGKWLIDEAAGTIITPDIRGEFLRAWANGQSIDAAREVGSWQEDEIKRHDHGLTPSSNIFGAGTPIGTCWLWPDSSNENKRTTFTGGLETRPRNIAYLYLFKAI